MTTQNDAQSVPQDQDGGQGGIRTLGELTPTHAFQACSLDHSDTCPERGGEAKKPKCVWQSLFERIFEERVMEERLGVARTAVMGHEGRP